MNAHTKQLKILLRMTLYVDFHGTLHYFTSNSFYNQIFKINNFLKKQFYEQQKILK